MSRKVFCSMAQSLLSLFSKLRSETAELGNMAKIRGPTLATTNANTITSSPKTSLIFGIPKIVAKVLGMAMMKVIQVKASITQVKAASRLFNFSFEVVNLTIAVIIRSSCFSIFNSSLSNSSSAGSRVNFQNHLEHSYHSRSN